MQGTCYNMDGGFKRANKQVISSTVSADREMGYLWDLSCTESTVGYHLALGQKAGTLPPSPGKLVLQQTHRLYFNQAEISNYKHMMHVSSTK